MRQIDSLLFGQKTDVLSVELATVVYEQSKPWPSRTRWQGNFREAKPPANVRIAAQGLSEIPLRLGRSRQQLFSSSSATSQTIFPHPPWKQFVSLCIPTPQLATSAISRQS